MHEKKNEFVEAVVNYAQPVAVSLVLFIIILKTAFSNESLLFIIKGALLFYWVYVIPGLLFTYIMFKDLKFLERFALAIVLAFAIVGILSYHFSLFLNWHIKSHHIYLPLIIIVVETGVLWWQGKKKQ